MRLRFAIRDLFWLILVIGLVLGWMADNRQKARENNRLQSDIRTAQAQAELAEGRADTWEGKLKQHIAGTLSDEEIDDIRETFRRGRDKVIRASDVLSRK